jgi:hypothetical protein
MSWMSRRCCGADPGRRAGQILVLEVDRARALGARARPSAGRWSSSHSRTRPPGRRSHPGGWRGDVRHGVHRARPGGGSRPRQTGNSLTRLATLRIAGARSDQRRTRRGRHSSLATPGRRSTCTGTPRGHRPDGSRRIAVGSSSRERVDQRRLLLPALIGGVAAAGEKRQFVMVSDRSGGQPREC